MTNWEDRGVIITGAATGIGRATALAFAATGAKVALLDVATEAAETTLHAVHKFFGRGIFIKCDVAQDQQVEVAVLKTLKEFGRLDAAFNNAGIEGKMAMSAECSEENFDRTLAVNLKGTWLCMKHELRAMLEHKRGAIVNCSSVAGLTGERMLCAYSAAKHGVIGLTRTAALEYATLGLRINAVCPGIIDTPMVDRVGALVDNLDALIPALQPIGRKGRPEEVAQTVLWLCSDAASLITGQALAVDGGYTAQ